MESLPIQATSQKRLVLRKLVWVGPLTIVMVALGLLTTLVGKGEKRAVSSDAHA